MKYLGVADKDFNHFVPFSFNEEADNADSTEDELIQTGINTLRNKGVKIEKDKDFVVLRANTPELLHYEFKRETKS